MRYMGRYYAGIRDNAIRQAKRSPPQYRPYLPETFELWADNIRQSIKTVIMLQYGADLDVTLTQHPHTKEIAAYQADMCPEGHVQIITIAPWQITQPPQDTEKLEAIKEILANNVLLDTELPGLLRRVWNVATYGGLHVPPRIAINNTDQQTV